MLTNAQMDLIFVFPTALVLGYFYTRVLDMPNKKLYMIVVVVLAFTSSVLRAGYTPEIKTVVGIVSDLLLPLLFSRGRFGRRVMTVALAEVCLFADEILGGALWLCATGVPFADYDMAREYFGAYVLMHVVHMAALIGMLALLAAALNRTKGQESISRLWMLAGFPVTQFALLFSAVYIGHFYFSASNVYYGACSIMAVVGLLVDVLFLRALDQWAKAEVAHQRAEAVERQLEEYYQHCETMLRHSEETAKFRHDMRNHLQTISSMASCGLNAEAVNYAEELEIRLRAGLICESDELKSELGVEAPTHA